MSIYPLLRCFIYFRYGQGPHRNTTDLPASGHRSPGGPGSPRLERAHSEPPGKFNERNVLALLVIQISRTGVDYTINSVKKAQKILGLRNKKK